jgi:hypothetical protein
VKSSRFYATKVVLQLHRLFRLISSDFSHLSICSTVAEIFLTGFVIGCSTEFSDFVLLGLMLVPPLRHR